MRHLLRLFGCLLLISSQNAFCDEQPDALQELSSHPVWLNLLHYEKAGLLQPRLQSAISSPEFFLAADGHQNPLAELQATLAALQQSVATDDAAGSHAVCRFPARALWLQSQLGTDLELHKNINCTDLDKWTRDNTVSSVSVVFATGYLGNPASYYGHTLLKFNFTGDGSEGGLMDASLNYGAIVENDDDPVTYIFKGIFGGYDGGFSHINFYFHNHNYGENELRDMWEYQLDLPPDAVELVTAHAWEVLGKRYTYYFFRRNCAYRMAEILEIVEGLKIVPDSRPWTIPQSLIQSLGDASYQSRPLLSEVRYHPSRQSRLYTKYQALSSFEQQLFKQLALEDIHFEDASFTGADLPSRQRILDTLLDYYQFIRDRAAGAEDPANLAHREALAMRYQLPPGLPSFANKKPESPHTGRAPSWFQLGITHNSDTSHALSVRLRPAYYDALDADHAHVKRAALSMGDLRLHISDQGIKLRQLDLISIASVSPALTGLPGDTGTAWNLKVGVEPLRLDCEHCLVPRIQADRGYGYRFDESLFSTTYIGAAVQESRLQEGYGFARIGARLNLATGSLWEAQLQVEHRLPVAAKVSAYNALRLEARRSMGSSQDLRLMYERNRGDELTLALGWYW
ncbi:Lnb N-terminal periplasmic domain-containing protein [Halopseudomonas salina]|uniref:Lnb N-terminal periplasmic domain-containing protein n=1 Tax=Halopseudomonas salina TaxID=1323744 RepID=UPI00166826E5|nr:DUF4105 domain-containing protein [Halopseudomonas salina]